MFKRRRPFDPSLNQLSLDDDEGHPIPVAAKQQEWTPHWLITKYIDTHPYTRCTEIRLGLLLDQAIDQAAEELKHDMIRAPRQWTDDDKLFMINHRAEQIMFMNAEMEDIVEMKGEMMSRNLDKQRHTSDQLDGIRQAVDRSAVTANAIDFAIAHPLIAGFLGSALIRKLKHW